MKQTIDEKFSFAMSHINANCQYYNRFYNLLEHRETTEEGVTMRVNMIDSVHPILEYNPEFMDKINSACLAVLLCAEINRLLLHHCTKRRMPIPALNYMASNIVCYDPCISNLFHACIESVTFDKELPNDEHPEIRKLLPKDYNHDRDCQLEVLYEMLIKNEEIKKKMVDCNAGNSEDPCDSEGENHQGNGKADEEGRNGKDQEDDNGNQIGGNSAGKTDIPTNQQGAGSSSKPNNKKDKSGDGKQNKNSNKLGSSEDMLDALKEHFASHPDKQIEKWGENDIANATISQRVNSMDAADWGNMPGNLRERIMAANRQVVDPRVALKNFIGTAYSNSLSDTRMKINRRLPELSGLIPGKRHDQTFKIGMFADASGSMSDTDIQLCIDTVNNFIKFEAEVHFAWWDCICEVPTEHLKPMRESQVSGGGGTMPQCILEMMKEHKFHYDGIIVMTDCYFDWPRPKEYKNIFIIRTPNAGEAPEWVGKRQMSMKALYSYLDKMK